MWMFSAVIDDLKAALSKLEGRVAVLEKPPAAAGRAAAPAAPCTNVSRVFERSAIASLHLSAACALVCAGDVCPAEECPS